MTALTGVRRQVVRPVHRLAARFSRSVWKYRALGRPPVYAALWVLDRCLPKVDQAVLAVSPDFDDQGLAIADELRRRGIPLVWLTRRPYTADELVPWPDPPGRVVCRWTPVGLWLYLRSRYIFYTHGIFGFAQPPRCKTVVNLWHGMPIKRTGMDDNRRPMRSTFTLATSRTFQRIISDQWNMPEPRVAITGLPRNDRLLGAGPVPPKLFQTLGERRVVLWLPTFRRSIRGDIRQDGTADIARPGGLSDFDVNAFDDMLERLNAYCILKMHQMADPQDYPESSVRMLVWNDQDLWHQGSSLYHLMRRADVLVSDASSVWVDFLLLDRPIVFAFGDMAQYEHDRGFAVEGIAEKFPGDVVSTYDRFARAVEGSLEGRDQYGPARRSMREVMHDCPDSRSAERVVDLTLQSPGRGGTA